MDSAETPDVSETSELPADDIADDPADDPADAPTIEPIVPSRRVDRFRTSTFPGAILNGIALGLREVLEPPKREDAPLIAEAPGDPPDPRHVETNLNPDDPAASSVTVRPWLAEHDPPT